MGVAGFLAVGWSVPLSWLWSYDVDTPGWELASAGQGRALPSPFFPVFGVSGAAFS